MSYKQSKELLDYSKCPKDNPLKEVKYTDLPYIKEEFSTVSKSSPKKTHVNYIQVEQDHTSTGNPEVWGPAFWFSLHNGALRYPKNASPIWKDRMKNFIIGIPVMVPCEMCSVHATAYIEKNYDKLDDVVSNRDKLFEFFHTFHNYVNKRLGKPQMSLEDAIKLYSSPAKVTKLQLNLE